MREGLLITFFLLLCSATTFAQESSLADEGSVYSKYGVGIPVETGSSNAIGAGVWGVSDVEPLVPNLANPALWGYTTYGMASGGAQIKNLSGADRLGTARHTFFSVGHFQLQVPIKKNKLGLSVSFTPYSRTAYQSIETGRKLKGSNPKKAVSYQTEDNAHGGLGRFELGIGWKINKNISLGYAASIYHASVNNDLSTTFSDKTYAPVTNTVINSGAGFGNRFGIYFTLPSMGSHKKQALNIGFTAALPVILHGQKNQQSPFVPGNPSQNRSSGETTIGSGDIQLPLELTGGITYKPSPFVAISAEGRYQNWADFYNELKQAHHDVVFKNRMKMGLGLQYFPVYLGSHKFLSHFKYRIGANYDTGYLKIRGQDIRALTFTAGLGLLSPSKVQGFNSSIDINFYYTILGTKINNLVKEHVFGIKLTLNLAELFFFRPKLQ
jgi:hypothetical protein